MTYNDFVDRRFEHFSQFWPFYVSEHSKKATRHLHFIGTTLMFLFLTHAIAMHSLLSLTTAILSAYGLAWASHFLIEKNRPATFRYPIFSLMGDFKMYGFTIMGRMDHEIARLKIHAA